VTRAIGARAKDNTLRVLS